MVLAAGDRGAQLASSSRGEEKAGDAEKRKPLKVAMEAMLRVFEMFAEEDEYASGDNCSRNIITAWHNLSWMVSFPNTRTMDFLMWAHYDALFKQERSILHHLSGIDGSFKWFMNMEFQILCSRFLTTMIFTVLPWPACDHPGWYLGMYAATGNKGAARLVLERAITFPHGSTEQVSNGPSMQKLIEADKLNDKWRPPPDGFYKKIFIANECVPRVYAD
ncbi:hypothetical protein U9M48_022896 [Paspalum notatum var. saurae]|uniref:Uncharacterized protein n=1 Tax=Paspalum notatum var. saurae TaxID=547442 RepID=A0AAQ3TLY1_PASNO